MNWEQTVLSDEEIEETLEEFCIYLEGHRNSLRILAKAQAQVSFKVGQRDVVEWFEDKFYLHGLNNEFEKEWQAKLKEWGLEEQI